MTKKKSPGELQKRGRKPIPINYELAEKMAVIGCTQSEISEILGISVKTFEANPKLIGIHKKGQEKLRASLRRMQYKSAQEGNVTMLIWLGKQLLGQRDKRDVELAGNADNPVRVTNTLDITKEVKKLVGILPDVKL